MQPLHSSRWCNDELSCLRRASTSDGSTSNLSSPGGFSFGLLDNDPTSNPTFAHANHVELWYCDGGSFSGDAAEAVVINGKKLYFRGKRVLDAILDFLALPKYGLSNATEVLVSGGSAGGLSVFLHADYVRTRIGQQINDKQAVVKFGAAPVSGFFLMHNSVEGDNIYPARMRNIYHMMNSSGGVNQRCLAALAPADGWKCIFANYSYAHMQTPVFPLQSSVDKWQMGAIFDISKAGNPDCTSTATAHQLEHCTESQRHAVAQYERDFLRDLMNASDAFTRPGNGGYIESCIEHVAGQGKAFNTYKNPTSGLTMQQALTAWWESGLDEPAEKHWQLPCQLHQHGAFGQCNPSCTAPLVPDSARQAACASDLECFGGKCSTAGDCVCPPLWSGPTCQTLRLKPARVATPGLLLPNTTTWGGGAVEDEKGQWHMFAARIEAHCGILSWSHNSDIVHATADAVDGPYSVQSTVLPTFSHGPTPTLLPDGRVIMAHLGCGNRTQPLVQTCRNGTTPASVTVAASRPPGLSNCDWPRWKGVLLSADHGHFSGLRWKQLANWSGHGLVVRAGPNSWHEPDYNGSSLADNARFWPFGNGSFLLAYANKLKHPPPPPAFHGHKHVGLAIGELPFHGEALQPFRDISEQPIFPWEVEDPDIFFDTTNNLTSYRWHMLGHRIGVNTSTGVCAHAVAASPFGPWKVATIPAYTRHIDWIDDDGKVSSYSYARRERPRMIMNRAGRPVAFSSAVTPGNGATPVTPRGYTRDFSHTLVQVLDPAY